MEVIKNKHTEKPNLKNQNQLDFLLERDVRKELSKRIPGGGTQDFIYLEVLQGDTGTDQKTNRQILNSTVFKVLAVGPNVTDENIVAGKWIQMIPSTRIITLDYGMCLNILIHEFEIVWIFDTNPKVEFLNEISKRKIVSGSKIAIS